MREWKVERQVVSYCAVSRTLDSSGAVSSRIVHDASDVSIIVGIVGIVGITVSPWYHQLVYPVGVTGRRQSRVVPQT